MMTMKGWSRNISEFSLQKVNHPRAFPKAESKTMLASFSSEFYSVEVRAVDVPRSSSILLRKFAISKVSRETLPEKRSYALLVHGQCMHANNACTTMYVRSNLKLIDRNSTLQIYSFSLILSSKYQKSLLTELYFMPLS